MAKHKTAAEGADLSDLVSGVVQDVGKLLGQQVDLLRGEVRREVLRAEGAALSVAIGGGPVAAGGLPLWCCYGAAGGCGFAGAALAREGRAAQRRQAPAAAADHRRPGGEPDAAQGAGQSDGTLAADPEAIRADMAQTRAALAHKLGVLKSRLFGGPART